MLRLSVLVLDGFWRMVVMVIIVVIIVMIIMIVMIVLRMFFVRLVLGPGDGVALLDSVDHLVDALQQRSPGLLVATIDDELRLNFASELILEGQLANLMVRLCIVGEEQTLVLSIAVNPLLKSGIVDKLSVSISFVVL